MVAAVEGPAPGRLDLRRIVNRTLVAAVALGCLYVIFLMYVTGAVLLAVVMLVAAGTAFWVYLRSRSLAMRYIFPGLAGIALFIVVPLAYTVVIGFTEYNSRNLLTQERAQAYFLNQTYQAEGGSYDFALYPADGDAAIIVLTGGDPPATFASDPVTLAGTAPVEIPLQPVDDPDALGEPLAVRDVVARRDALGMVTATLPDGTALVMSGLRSFAAEQPAYTLGEDGVLIDNRTGGLLVPDFETGQYRTADGEGVSPGFRVFTGFDNYVRIFTNPGITGPFLRIFAWTVVFAGLTVVFAFSIGFVLACLLQWERLAFRSVYRVLLILPYAVPAFISILVFRGLFNNEFGEINLILSGLFGIRPAWFTDPFLAKVMILIVNAWLGYPYMFILASGLLQVVPKDLYESSAIDGAGVLSNFFRITLPSVIRPFTPLLIAAFAFNFNNFTLIALLTRGRPDILGAATPAGTNDILVSYTYRIAFQDSGQDFGLAAAISTLIFFIVAALAALNIWLTRQRG